LETHIVTLTCFQDLLERLPFLVLTDNAKIVQLLTDNASFRALLPDSSLLPESRLLTDGNPAKVLLSRFGLDLFRRKTNPLLQLRGTVAIVAAEIFRWNKKRAAAEQVSDFTFWPKLFWSQSFDFQIYSYSYYAGVVVGPVWK
jgi:hypothetical protein